MRKLLPLALLLSSSFLSQNLITRTEESYITSFRTIRENVCAEVDSREYCPNKEQIMSKDDEEFDYWQLPEETLKRGKGDCEDFSIKHFYDIRRKYNCELMRGYFLEDKKSYQEKTLNKWHDHIWLEIILDDDRIISDPILGIQVKLSDMLNSNTRYLYVVNTSKEARDEIDEFCKRMLPLGK